MSEARNGMGRRLAAAARSDRGRVRANNEDLPLLDVERGIYGVIDGVGGQNAGELAASIARDVILQRLGRPLGTPAERVREAIAIANNEIFRRASASPELAGMTCVVTLALVHDASLTIGHVGDTRLYKISPDGLRKLTHDHSPVGEREDAQELSEAEAMRHPRRHEVFRDVGSALRDKDEDDYVEVVEDAIEDDGAVLVCSDGLTDMITAGAIEQIVRTHAGKPEAVADALVAAANEAGGRDNVTVVYAEGPAFAAAMRGRAAKKKGGDSLVTRTARAIAASRTTWFLVGAMLGVVGALAFVWRTSEAPVVGGRTIAAAPAATETVGTLAAALSTARPGDIVRLEPGTYAEQVVLPPGVTLAARVPGGATFVRAPAVESSLGGEWVAITATGDAGGAITGISIASTAEQPIDVGLRVTGHGRAIELVEADGPMRVAMDLAEVSSARLEGSRFTVTGTPVAVGSDARLEAVGNVFRAEDGVGSSSGKIGVGSYFRGDSGENDSRPHFPNRSRPHFPAITLATGAEAILRQNVFAGFGPEPVQGLAPAAREPFGRANVVLSADRSAAR